MTEVAENGFEKALAAHAEAVERFLSRALDERPRSDEIDRPVRLVSAMRHGVLNGGKRLRPLLVMESTAVFRGDKAAALRVAGALECIHCYSLIHDDLPAMDDDDLRRGQPTVHKAFDEATAILAGDSLLTYAFELIADDETLLPAERKLALVLALSRAAGLGGMAGGQALDLEAEKVQPDEAGIIRLQAMKTGALIRFACEAGAIIAGASPADRETLAAYGSAIGLAFQLADDLLDLTATPEMMGKATGKDDEAGKATLVALHGVEWARRQLDGLVEQAEALLEPFGDRARTLKAAGRFVAARQR